MKLRNIIRRIARPNNNQSLKNPIGESPIDTVDPYSDRLIQDRIDYLGDKTSNSNIKGVSHENRGEEQLIVSLTTFGERINQVYLPIESIMQGSMKPDKIILWLAKDEFEGKTLPITLQKQQNRGLEIAYCHDLKQYNKLIHTLEKYPNSSIITIDDDALYEDDLLERLYTNHLSHRNTICACRMHRIRTDENNNPLPYLQWDLCIEDEDVSILNFPTGVGGVLYPPHCFSKEVFNSEVFMDICPKADDIWFYAMARIANVSSRWVKNDKPQGYYLPLPLTNDALSLYNTSTIDNGNDIQFQKVIKQYHISLTTKN